MHSIKIPSFVDTFRETGHLVQQAYDWLLYNCSTSGSTRLRAVGRVCKALSAFASSMGFPDIAEFYWTKLVLYLLEIGPDPDWTKIGTSLLDSLRSSQAVFRNQTTFYEITRALQDEEWGEDGASLRVRG